MPDPRILLEPERVYHIYTHASGSENLFRSDENYRYFLGKYTKYIYPVAETYAYCLMPNHLHLMVKIRSIEELLTLQGFDTLEGLNEGLNLSKAVSQKISHLFNGYTQAYNKMYDRKGSLFISRFKRKLIDSDSYFTALIAYIHNNPVHHGFTRDAADWPHSSWHSYLSLLPTKIERAQGLDWFGGKEVFVKIHCDLKNHDVNLHFED